MATHRDPDTVLRLLRDEVVGRSVTALEVHGINSLKTQEPSLTSLVGQRVQSVEVGAGTVLRFRLTKTDIEVDLQRVGVAQHMADLGPWTFGAGPQPTVRLLLDDGSGVDFKEPSRTKRITVRLSDTIR